MQNALTGQEVLQHFISCCKKRSKLFVPDTPRQEQVCDALGDFYEIDILFDAIDEYIKVNPGPFVVFDFAVQSKKYIDHIINEKKSRESFLFMVKETKKRMELE
jgi:hypothetical protein